MDYIKLAEDYLLDKGPIANAGVRAFARYLATLGEKEASKCEHVAMAESSSGRECLYCHKFWPTPQPIKEEKIEELGVPDEPVNTTLAIIRLVIIKLNEVIRALNRRTDK